MSDSDTRKMIERLARSGDPQMRKLAELARSGDAKTTDALAQLVAAGLPLVRSVRKRSSYEFLGLPLWSVAFGPDIVKGEMRGHAKGVFAVGDIATGIVAIGGLARGVFAFGGLALGLVAFGGLAIGGFALGGGAIGLAAMGGGALGIVAIGGGAVGVYAAGGGAFGEHVISAVARDPEAVRFFSELGLDWAVRRR